MHPFVCLNVTVMMYTCDAIDCVAAGNVDVAGGVDGRVGVGSTLKGLSPAIGVGWLLCIASQ